MDIKHKIVYVCNSYSITYTQGVEMPGMIPYMFLNLTALLKLTVNKNESS